MTAAECKPGVRVCYPESKLAGRIGEIVTGKVVPARSFKGRELVKVRWSGGGMKDAEFGVFIDTLEPVPGA